MLKPVHITQGKLLLNWQTSCHPLPPLMSIGGPSPIAREEAEELLSQMVQLQ